MVKDVLELLTRFDTAVGERHFEYAIAAGAADDLLHVVIGDGQFTVKLDGAIHAANLTAKSIAAFIENEGVPKLDIAEFTAWTGGNAAVRYGRWQTDFHWKIDTRLWQYLLYFKFYRDSFLDCINQEKGLTESERAELRAAIYEFFDQAQFTLAYRWEILERSRAFATHPDKTCGASRLGYEYEVLRPLPDLSFEQLPLSLSLAGDAAVSDSDDRLAPFPRLTGEPRTSRQILAKAWLDHAQRRGVADRWLCVRLGDRMVPTRFNGWEDAIELFRPFLKSFAEGRRIQDGRAQQLHEKFADVDLSDGATRFGLCQSIFQRRLRGGVPELIELLSALQQALDENDRNLACELDLLKIPKNVRAAFFRTVISAIPIGFETGDLLDESSFPELGGRPIHPRFAPFDPLEPLPWETSSPDLYLKRMKHLAYVI